MTLLCIDNQQSSTHKGNFLQGGKQQPVTNLNQHQQHNTNHRWNSGSPPLTKSKERSNSEDRKAANNANSQTNSSRYKTELCRPYEESGSCKYGDKCQFAHGHKELRSLARHPKYKTELCRTFHSTGLCPYGPRCHFIHNSEQGRKGMLLGSLRQEPAPPSGRPKPLGSLGSSSGELSPTSSHGGSPTGSKSFDELFVSAGGFPMAPQDLASLVHQSLLDYPQEAYDVFGDGFVGGGGDSPLGNDGYGGSPPVLDLFLSRTPLTPNTPLDASAGFFRLPIFDLFHKQ